MDNLLGSAEAVRSPIAVFARVTADAKRSFGAVADEATIEVLARQAIDEIYGDSIKVTTFVPVLAMRHIREALDSTGSSQVAVAGSA